MLNKLATFKGYVIDYRLHELRKMEYGKLPEFIPFESRKGQKLLEQYKKYQLSGVA